jgi:hypothetical protein
MAEDLNGGLSMEVKQRRSGDNWMSGNNLKGNTVIVVASDSNNVLPDMYMDRDRTKLRANLDWDPSDKLSVQAVVEHGQDDYKRDFAPVATQFFQVVAGARVVTNDSVSLDASYKISDTWKLSGYWTHSESRWAVNKKDITDDTRNTTDTFGFGISGKAAAKLLVGLDILAANDVTTLNNQDSTKNIAGLGVGNIAGFSAARPGNYLPDISYNTVKLNLFGIYEIDKKSAIKVNVAYQEFKSDDWQWAYNGVPFVYSDNTTVSNPNQAVTFIGAAYVHKF